MNAALAVMLATFPPSQSGDGETVLAAYEWVMQGESERDVIDGVDLVMRRKLPGFDGRFAPTAPQLAQAIQMARDRRLESERRSRLLLPPPASREVSPEERAVVAGKFSKFIANVGVARSNEAALRRADDRIARTNARFHPDLEPEAVKARLGLARETPPVSATIGRSSNLAGRSDRGDPAA